MTTTEGINQHLKVLNKNHLVKIRVKKLKDGSHSIFLDHWIGEEQKRDLVYLKLRLTGDKSNDKEAWLRAEKRRQIMENEVLDPSDRPNQKLRNADFYEFMEHLTIKKASKNWQACLNWLRKYYPKRLPFSRIDRDFMEGFRDYLVNDTKLHRNTSKLFLAVFKTAINQAVMSGYMKQNPGKGINVKGLETVKSFLTKEQITTLSNTPCGNDEVKQAFLFACYTGLRVSDIMALTWSSIENDQITLRQKKTEGLLIIPMLSGAKKILASRPSKTGKIFTLSTYPAVNSMLKAWVKRSGIEQKITFHCARHTFAILSLEAGVPINVLQRQLGHTMLSNTLVYAKIQDSMLKQAAEQMDSYLEKE